MSPPAARIRSVSVFVLATAVAWMAGGCSRPAAGFDSPTSGGRLDAIRSSAARGDESAIPDLIRLLDSDDAAVRFAAIETLEGMTGERLGYEPGADPFERRAAIDRWVDWYDRRTPPAGGTPG